MTTSQSKYYTIQVRRATFELGKKHWWSKIPGFISTRTQPSLLVELSIGGLSQKAVIVKDPSLTWDRTFPLLASKTSDTLLIRVIHDSYSSVPVTIGRGDVTLDMLLRENGDKEVSIPLRPSSNPKDKPLGFLYVCLKMSNAEDCVKLSLSNLLIDCGEPVGGSEYKIGNIDAMIKGTEIVMKSNLPKLFQDAVPALDAFSNAIKCLTDAHPYLKLAWGITTALLDVVQRQAKFDGRVRKLAEDVLMAFYIAKDISQIHRQIESLSHLATGLIDFLIDCCIHIRAYSLRSFTGRVLHPGEKSEIEDCEETIKKLKADIDSAFCRQDAAINSRRADDALLRKLKDVLKPVHLSGFDRPHCLENTRISIREEIDDWVQNTTSPNVFLLLGGAGTGKSTISTTIAEEFRRKDSLGCHLFCLRSKSDPTTVIRTIAYNLAVYNQNIAECIEDALKDKGELISATLDTQFNTFLYIPLHQSHINSRPILIVLDALDECGMQNTRRPLITLFRDKLSTLPTNYRFLITGRPEEDISSLSHSSHFRIVRLNDYDGTDDVHLYINIELDKMKERGMIDVEDGLGFDNVKRKLGEAADGLFIWASTAIRMIEDAKRGRMSKLKQLAKGGSLPLDDLYSVALRNALDWDDETKKLFSDIMGLILFGKEQMTDLKIDGILGMKGATSDILSCLRSLIIYDPGKPIRLHHTSFFDYLLSSSTKNESWHIDETESKRRIAEQCFVAMDRMLHFNMCRLESSYVANRDVVGPEGRVQNYIPEWLQYTCINWSDHLRDAPYSNELRDALKGFVYNHLLFWLEVMSLTNTLDTRGGSILTYAISWLGGHDRELSNFLIDCQHQITIFSMPISSSAPHIYMSLLPLSKDDSKFSRHYSKYCGTLSNIEYNGSKLRSACLKLIKGHRRPTFSVSFSPDSTQVVSGSEDETIRVWDTASGRLTLGPIECNSEVTSVSFSPDGSFIASGLGDGSIKFWDLRDGELFGVLFEGDTGSIESIQFSRDGDYIVSGSYSGTIRIWDVESRKLHKELPISHSDVVRSVSISNDSQYVTSGSYDKTVIIWNISNTPITFIVLRDHMGEVNSVAFAQDGNTVASGSVDGTIRIWNTSNGELVYEIPQFGSEEVFLVLYSPDGKFFLSGSGNGMIRMWNTSDFSESPKLFQGHANGLYGLSFASNGSYFVSSSLDGTIRVWDVMGGMSPHRKTSGVNSISISRDGELIASGMQGGTVCVYDARSGNIVLGPFKGHTDTVYSVAFSPHGKLIASGSGDKKVRLWNMEGDSDFLVGPRQIVTSIAFSPNGLNVAAGSRDKVIYVWDVESKDLCFDLVDGHSGPIRTIGYSTDGTKLLSGSEDCTIRIWDAVDGYMIGDCFGGHESGVLSAVYSPDDTRIVSGSFDGTILIWGAETGEIYKEIKEHSEMVNSLAFSPDGKRFLSGSDDLTIRIWDVETGKSVCEPFVGHSGTVESVKYFPDGNRFASGSQDGSIRIWTIPNEGAEWYMKEDGWIVGREKELLIWIPSDLRYSITMPTHPLTINRTFETKLDFSGHFEGRSWTSGIPSPSVK